MDDQSSWSSVSLPNHSDRAGLPDGGPMWPGRNGRAHARDRSQRNGDRGGFAFNSLRPKSDSRLFPTTSKCIACSTQHSSAQAGTDTDGGDETNDYHRCV